MSEPTWKDAPDAPGLWLGRYSDGVSGVYQVTERSIAWYTKDTLDSMRYFGPVPPDTKVPL